MSIYDDAPPSAERRAASAIRIFSKRAIYASFIVPLFRRASTPRTEVIDTQVPHQSYGTLMRGPAGRAAVVLGQLPSPWRGEHISRLARAQNTPHSNWTGSWPRVASRIDAHEKAKLADNRRHCSALGAAQGLPNGDPE